MIELLYYLKSEWQILKKTPFTFLLLMAITSAVTWWLARLLSRNSKESLQGKLELSEARNEDYQRKLDVSSADEASDKFKQVSDELQNLRKMVSELQPRRIDAAGKKAIISAVSIGVGHSIEIILDLGAPETAVLVADLREAFERSGWRVSLPTVIGVSSVLQLEYFWLSLNPVKDR